MSNAKLRFPRSYLGFIVLAIVFGFASFLGHGPMSQELRSRMDENQPFFSPQLDFRLTEVSNVTHVFNSHMAFKVHPTLANVEPYLSSFGASVAVVDFDNDGWPDVYLNNSEVGSKNRLFKNNHDGTFTDVAADAGIADVNSPHPSTRAIFFDSTNSGFKDLFLLSYCPRFFLNQRNGTFREVTGESRFGCGFFYGGVNVIDYDEDGFLDIVIAPYLGRDLIGNPENTKVMPNSFHEASNGEKLSVFHNDGKGHFSPVNESLGVNRLGWTHSIGVYDLRGTGRPDVWLPTDYNTDRLSFNDGGGHFRDVSENIVRGNFSRNGMSVDFADIDNDRHPVAYVSHIYIPGQRVTGNVLWKWQKDKQFLDIAKERGVESCGWSWGAKFIDFKNNGNLDLFVGNGFISASKTKSYWYPMNVLDSAAGSVLTDINNWPPMGSASLAGYQKSCLFLNEGGKFVNVASSTALAKDASDARGVAVIDYLNNGSQSIIIANQKQGSRFYRNDQLNANQWIGFKLIGTKSNRDAIGAEIELKLKDRVLTKQLQPLNGYASQSDDRIHFGLGKRPSLESLTIVWPSHIRQILKPDNLRLNSYQVIREPRS